MKPKRITAFLLSVAMILSLMPTFTLTAFAAGVEYYYCIDNGITWKTGTQETYNQVTEDDTEWGTEGNDTWYYVTGRVTISDRVTVKGTVKLILADGCSLIMKRGIYVGAGNKLIIYGQTNGTGTLLAEGDNQRYNAAIGGDQNCACGDITIYGGNISAGGYSDWTAAGIGGGEYKNGGTITIYGGTVKANSCFGAGIGGGKNGACGTVNIYGGRLRRKA